METATGSGEGIQEDIQRALRAAREEFGGFKVVRKRSSAFMWFLYGISGMWVWNRKFMTHYVTTISGTIYTPWGLGEHAVSDLALISHETQHERDARQIGPLWYPAYLFPQCLALLALGALGAFWTPWAWLSLIALLALGPWPAPFRVWAELRGYDESLRILLRHRAINERVAKDWLHGVFCGWGYFRMAWRWQPIHDHITQLCSRFQR